jgi:HD-GYP domain-containing protein (c-di-GMP phosphodiesterase class II)
MLKRIQIKQLRMGMYCSSWVNTTALVKKSFLLDDRNELDQIINSGIKEVFIDTSKGLDVLSEPVSAPIVKKAAGAAAPKKAVDPIAPLPISEELHQASKIVNRSKEAITSMFNEARMGKAVNVESAVLLVTEITSSVMRNPSALIGLARLKTKDDYTYMHSVAVCALMVSLARQLGLSDEQTRESGLAGLLHDIGKMAVPLDILNNSVR